MKPFPCVQKESDESKLTLLLCSFPSCCSSGTRSSRTSELACACVTSGVQNPQGLICAFS